MIMHITNSLPHVIHIIAIDNWGQVIVVWGPEHCYRR